METYFRGMSAEEGTKEKLAQDLMTLLHDAEDLIKATGEELTEKSKKELQEALQRMKVSCRKIEEKAAITSRRTDRLVRDYPYEWMGAAFGVGLLIGVLVTRR